MRLDESTATNDNIKPMSSASLSRCAWRERAGRERMAAKRDERSDARPDPFHT